MNDYLRGLEEAGKIIQYRCTKIGGDGHIELQYALKDIDYAIAMARLTEPPANIEAWMTDENRVPWVINSLKARCNEFRKAATTCRNRFKNGWLSEQSRWLADCYDEAAESLERRLAELRAQAAPGGEKENGNAE